MKINKKINQIMNLIQMTERVGLMSKILQKF